MMNPYEELKLREAIKALKTYEFNTRLDRTIVRFRIYAVASMIIAGVLASCTISDVIEDQISYLTAIQIICMCVSGFSAYYAKINVSTIKELKICQSH